MVKNSILKFVLALTLAVSGSAVFGQSPADDPKYGETPKERHENIAKLNNFAEAYKAKDYDAALALMKDLVAAVPASTENLYINGINIYKRRYAQSGSGQEKVLYSDSIMTLYDIRAEYFGANPQRKQGYIAALKAKDCMIFRPWDMEGIRSTFYAAAKEAGSDIDQNLLLQYFTAFTGFYRKGAVTPQQVKEEYVMLCAMVYEVCSRHEEDKPAHYENASADVRDKSDVLYWIASDEDNAVFRLDAAFAALPFVECDEMVPICERRLSESNGTPFETVRAVKMLEAGKCGLGGAMRDEFENVLFEVDPSSKSAILQSAYLFGLGDYEGATSNIDKAAASEPRAKQRSLIYTLAGKIEAERDNAANTAKYARKALDENPLNFQAQMLMVLAHAAEGMTGCTGFEARALYWVLYDLCAQAEKIGTEDDRGYEMAREYMELFESSFPTRDECFFQGLKEGEDYRLECGWMSVVTKVRYGK